MVPSADLSELGWDGPSEEAASPRASWMAPWPSRAQAAESEDGRTVRPSLATVGPVGALLLGDAARESLLAALLTAPPDEDPPDEHADAAASIKSPAKPAVMRLPENIGTHTHDEPIARSGRVQVTHDVTFAQ